MDKKENNKFIERMRAVNRDALWPTGFADAIIDLDTEHEPPRFIMSTGKIVSILVNEHKMPVDDALEYYSYNIAGSYLGPSTPVYDDDLGSHSTIRDEFYFEDDDK
jgi:hypothetical protein